MEIQNEMKHVVKNSLGLLKKKGFSHPLPRGAVAK